MKNTEIEVNKLFTKNIELLTEDKKLMESKEKILKRGVGGRRMWLRSVALAAKKYYASLSDNEREQYNNRDKHYIVNGEKMKTYTQRTVLEYISEGGN